MEELETYAETITNPERFLEILKQRFEQSETAIHNAVNARSRMRLDSVMNNLEKRKLLEISNIQKILDDLEQTIRQELNQPEPAQLLLWPEIERNQLKRDLEALRARLQRLPDERILEEQAIIARYSEFQDHTFPVAVIFYIPEKLL